MSVYKYREGWRVQVRKRNARPFDKVFGTKAEAVAAEREHLESGVYQPVTGEITLADAWERYKNSAEFQGKAEWTRRTEETRVKPLLAVLGRYTLQHMEKNPGVVYDYIDTRSASKAKRTGKKLSATSVRLEIATLAAIVEWSVLRKILRANFVTHIRRPVTKKRRRRVPAQEQAKIHNAVLSFDAQKELAEPGRFFLLLRAMGRRPGEVAGLLYKDVSLRKHEALFRSTKPGEDQRIHLTPEAVNLLDAQLKYRLEAAPDSPYVFSTRSNPERRKDKTKPVPKWVPYNYATRVKTFRASELVGDDFHSHAMRREFVSRAIEAGIPYSVIRKQTGHKSTQAIEIYDEGLSTAPEIREILDEHLSTVQFEQLIGAYRNMGATDAQVDTLVARMRGEEPSPFSIVHADGSTEPIKPGKPNKKRRG